MAVVEKFSSLGTVLFRSTALVRKRIAVSMDFGEAESCTPPKKQCSDKKSLLEELHMDILVKIVCGVEHDDLKSLFFVSRVVRKASLRAKSTHFAYSTPKRRIGVWDADNVEIQKAPKQVRMRVTNRIRSGRRLTEITTNLFPSEEEECCLCPNLKGNKLQQK